MFDTDLIAFLRAELAGAGGRVYTGNADQGKLRPFVVVNRFSGITPSTLNGTRLFSRSTFKIDCVAETYPDALPLANDLRELLHAYKGLIGATRIESCRCLSEPTPLDVVDGDLILRDLQQDFLFVYR